MELQEINPTSPFMSQQINELATALCNAQSAMDKAVKSSNNPFFKSKYADITSCLEASLPTLHENGLAICQLPKTLNGEIGVRSILMHKSGQWIYTDLFLPVGGKKDAQAGGSAITYARRYTLTSMLGMGQEDDDGNKASAKVDKQGYVNQSAEQDSHRTITTEECDELKYLAKKNGYIFDDLRAHVKTLGYEKVKDLNHSDWEYAMITFKTPKRVEESSDIS